MKRINCKISNKAYKILINYKLDNDYKTMEEALDKFIVEKENANNKYLK